MPTPGSDDSLIYLDLEWRDNIALSHWSELTRFPSFRKGEMNWDGTSGKQKFY